MQKTELGIDLRNIFNQVERMRNPNIRNYVAGSVIEIIEDQFECEPGYIASNKRKKTIAVERNAAAYILVNLGYSQKEVSRLIKKHPSGIYRYYEKHVEQYEVNEDYRNSFDLILDQLPAI